MRLWRCRELLAVNVSPQVSHVKLLEGLLSCPWAFGNGQLAAGSISDPQTGTEGLGNLLPIPWMKLLCWKEAETFQLVVNHVHIHVH